MNCKSSRADREFGSLKQGVKTKMLTSLKKLRAAVAAVLLAALLPANVLASSHMDAPLITLDPAANTTDVYAFVDQDGTQKSLVLALGVYPHQEPGIDRKSTRLNSSHLVISY